LFRGALEVKLQGQLQFPRIDDRVRNHSETPASEEGSRVPKVGVIKGIERFRAELNLHGFSDWKTLEQAQVHIGESRAMVSARATVAEGSVSWSCKCRLV
jgi:hypothetical protein